MSGTDIRCMVKEYRRRKGLSQDELGRLTGLGRQAVYDVESGRYLPNTAVALRLARALGCTVEMLFVEDAPAEPGLPHLPYGSAPGARLVLARVRDRLIGVPQPASIRPQFRLEASDALLLPDGGLDCQLRQAQLANTILVMGCDPALSVLGGLVGRVAPGIRAHTAFASSRQALLAVSGGNAHVAGMHYHSFGAVESNVEAVRALSPELACRIIAFSVQEEGLMVAHGNPLGIRGVEDIANQRTRFVNREEGSALRKLLDEQLERRGLPVFMVAGYADEARSHEEGALRVASGSAGAALGLRIVAEAFGLGFVPLAVTRCDLIIPADLCAHPGITALMDVLQSAALRKELDSLAGYSAVDTGKIVQG